jgi:hypothetical protein
VDFGAVQQKSAAYGPVNPASGATGDCRVDCDRRYFAALNPLTCAVRGRPMRGSSSPPPAMKDIEVPRPRELLDKPRVAALLPILERQLKMDRSSCAHDSADITELPSTL